MGLLRLAVVATCAWLVSMPSEAQTGLSQTDRRRIDEVTAAVMKAAVPKDVAAWAALYLDDAVVNPPNQPAVKGRTAIRAWLEAFPPIVELTLNNVKVEGRGDLAYVLGTYSLTIAPPGAPGPITDSGNFLTIRRRQADGRWLVEVSFFRGMGPWLFRAFPPWVPVV